VDIQTLLHGVANYGFPMILSWYLLVRIEDRLSKLTEAIGQLGEKVAAKEA
jgi:hypothetical protein